MTNQFFTLGNTLVFFIILLLTLLSVLYGHRKKTHQIESKEESIIDYLLMGRALTLPFFVTSLVSTWYGGIFGVTQISFESGVYNFITQGVFWYVTYIIFAFFLVDKIKKYEAVTLPHMVSTMFGPRSGKVAALFNLINVIPIAYTISLGILLDTLFGLGMSASMLLGTSFVLAYSLVGGFRAVIFSDFIQFFVMFLSVLLVLICSIFKFGGLSYLQNHLPQTHFSLTGGHGLAATLAWGLIALSTLVDPNFYQRVFAAKDASVAKKGILISTAIWVIFDLCTTLGGMYARAYLPEANSQKAYLMYALGLLPNYLQGFFLAGIVATIVSTLDSYLFLAGSTLAHDLFPKRFRHNIKSYQLSTFLVALISLAIAHFFTGGIKDVWKILGSLSASCLLFPVLLGHFFPGKIKDTEFLFVSLASVLAVGLWIILPLSKRLQNIDSIYVGCVTSLLTLIFVKISTKMLRSKYRNS